MARRWRPLLALTSIVLAAGCAGSVSPSPSGFLRPVPSGSVGTMFAIDEIGLGANGYVSLTNFTDAAAATKGLFLCQGMRCFPLPDATVEAGDTARVAVSDGSGLQHVIATSATIGELRSTDGEVALYASPNVDDPAEILAYLEWGSTPHRLTSVAVEAGLWLKGSYAPTSARATRLYRDPTSGLWLFDG